MFKHDYNHIKFTTVVLITAVVFLFLTATLYLVVFNERTRLNILYDQQTQQHIDDYYKVSRITFCYDNNLRPCTDENIITWNTAHPEDQFSITSPKL